MSLNELTEGEVETIASALVEKGNGALAVKVRELAGLAEPLFSKCSACGYERVRESEQAAHRQMHVDAGHERVDFESAPA